MSNNERSVPERLDAIETRVTRLGWTVAALTAAILAGAPIDSPIWGVVSTLAHAVTP